MKLLNIKNDFKKLISKEEKHSEKEKEKILFEDELVAEIKEKLERRKTEKLPYETKWLNNANFLMGNQKDYSYFDTYDSSDFVSDSIGEHEVFNRISPLIESRLANLKKLKYSMVARSKTNEPDDISKAEITTKIIRHKQKTSDFDEKMATALVWNEITGNAFIMSFWDNTKGRVLFYKDSVPIKEGDVEYMVVSPFEVYPENINSSGMDSQRSLIIEQVKSKNEVYDLYGIKTDGGFCDTFCSSPDLSGGIIRTKVPDSVKVITYFELPSRTYEKGRMVLIAGDKLVHYSDMPYEKIPVVQLKCRDVSCSFFASGIIEELIPLQKSYNSCVNRIHEYIKRIAIGEYFVEEGSIDIEDYEENGLKAGAMLVYRQGANPPVRVPIADFPTQAMNERLQLQTDMEYTAGVSRLTVVGQTPIGVTSGTAMEKLKDIDNTRIAVTGDYIRNAVCNLAKIWLDIYKRFAMSCRIVKISGTDLLSDAFVWTKEEVCDCDIEFEAENELSFSFESQRQRFLQCWQMGLFTDKEGKIPEYIKRRAREFMEFEKCSDVLDTDTLQSNRAKRENVLLTENIIPKIEEYDDDKIHYEEHLRYALEFKFSLFEKENPEMAKLFKEHIKNHKERI